MARISMVERKKRSKTGQKKPKVRRHVANRIRNQAVAARIETAAPAVNSASRATMKRRPRRSDGASLNIIMTTGYPRPSLVV